MAKLRSGGKKVKRGLVLPGYKYLGPFNSVNKGEATNPSDFAAQKHDNEYWHLSKKGINPYINFNEADKQFIKDTKEAKDWGGRIANWIFTKKQKLAESGWIGTHHQVKEPRSFWKTPPTTNVKRSLDKFSPAAKKKLRFGDTPQITPSEPPPRLTMGEAKKDGEGSGNEKGLSETPLDNVVDVTRGPPNYTFVSLPMIREEFIAESVWSLDKTWRMTSVYDTHVTHGARLDINAGAGSAVVEEQVADGADASAQSCRWFTFYAGLYDYYHVVSCRWVMVIENQCTNPFYVHVIYHNDTQPPQGATNQDMMLWSGVKSHFVGTYASAMTSLGETERQERPSTSNENREDVVMSGTGVNFESGNEITSRGPSPIVTITGSYEPGDFQREIRLDSEVENWTAVTTNPTLTERLTFRFRHAADGISLNSANSYNRGLVFNYKMKLEYLVEFRQLKTALRWPVQRQPITVTLNSTVDSTG